MHSRFRNYAAVLLGILAYVLFSGNGCAPSVRYARDNPPEMEWFPSEKNSSSPVASAKLQKAVSSYLGVRYKYGGMSREGLDCSGFVSLVYKEVYGMSLPRSSGKQWKEGRIVPPATAVPGDLIFFRGGMFNGINHVGIYMGGNRFVHASSSNGVIYSTMTDPYYSRRFAAIRRMF